MQNESPCFHQSLNMRALVYATTAEVSIRSFAEDTRIYCLGKWWSLPRRSKKG